MNIAGWEWARYKKEKQKRWEEEQKRTRKFAEGEVIWQLPDDMLPVRSKKIKWRKREHNTCWYINGSNDPKSFVYLLKEIESDLIRYVGITDDPPRRHMEHRRDNKLGTQFTMVIVDVGGTDAEREWIARCLSDGCNLLNIVSTK